MRYFKIILITVFLMMPVSAQAQEKFLDSIDSVTVEGGPIWTKHFQSDDEDFRENHGLAVVKVHTTGYGNWGLYYLGPNSVRDTSIGAGYVTEPWTIPLWITELELSGALGLVTGYQDYPVPLIAAQARLKLFESEDGRWNAGIDSAALPYYAEDDRTGNDDFGVVATTPFLSVRYNF